MAASLRASLLAIVLLTTLLPLAVLAYLDLQELDARDERDASEFENRALALALRADAAAREGQDPLATLGAAAPDERVYLLDAEGRWRAPDGSTGSAEALRDIIGDRLSGVAEAMDPATGADARVAWARAPATEAAVVVARDPLPPVSLIDWTFLALLGFLGGGGILLAAGLTWLVVRPVRRLEQSSRRLAGGAWGERAEVEGAREVRSLARAFNVMAAEMGALHEARGRRLAQKRADLEALQFAMAHEVREPLRSIRWMLDEGLDTGDPEPLRLARDRVDAVDAMIVDLMRYETIASMDVPIAPVDLGQVLDRARDAADVPARVVVESKLPTVQGNAELLLQAMVEVLRNVVQHADGRLIVRAAEVGGHALLRFDDGGPGIPPRRREDALQLFQRFHRGAGTGVGLAIVRRVAERHGGSARLDEAPEGGVRVEMRLPVAGPPDAGQPIEALPGRRF